jgi:SAM-dependent methyltransferase
MMADHTQRFSDRVSFYTRARPRYPAAVLRFLQTQLPWSPGWVVADIGAGTGLLAELFVHAGNKVVGVEPNTPMRAAAVELLVPWENFSAVDGTAEATTLTDESVDLVTAGQAFHWFDAGKAKTEFARILRGDKPVLLVWNKRKRDGDGFNDAYQSLVARHQIDRSAVESVDASDNAGGVLNDFFAPHGFILETFDNPQMIDREGFLDRLTSSSYMPLPPDPRNAAVMREAGELFDRHQSNGVVRIEHETRVYLGRAG